MEKREQKGFAVLFTQKNNELEAREDKVFVSGATLWLWCTGFSWVRSCVSQVLEQSLNSCDVWA